MYHLFCILIIYCASDTNLKWKNCITMSCRELWVHYLNSWHTYIIRSPFGWEWSVTNQSTKPIGQLFWHAPGKFMPQSPSQLFFFFEFISAPQFSSWFIIFNQLQFSLPIQFLFHFFYKNYIILLFYTTTFYRIKVLWPVKKRFFFEP